MPLLIICLILTGCLSKPEKPSLVVYSDLVPERIINEINRKFLTKGTLVYTIENGFIVAEPATSIISILNENFEHQVSFGEKGNGPGEIGFLASLTVYGKEVYVHDTENLRISSFNLGTGEFIDAVSLRGTGVYYDFDQFFILDNGFFIFNTFQEKKPFVILDSEGQLVSTFGKAPLENSRQTQSRNYDRRLLQITGGQHVIALATNGGYFERYQDSSLVTSTNFSNDAFFASNMTAIAEAYKQYPPPAVLSMFTKWVHHEGLIFALYADWAEETPGRRRIPCKIVVADISEGFKLLGVLDLCKKGIDDTTILFHSLAVYQDQQKLKLVLSESVSSQLHIYDLSETIPFLF